MPATYVTADLPGTGGRLRHAPSDFLVEELPLYEPCGEGDHLYLRIEKRGLTTHDAARRIARALGVKPRSVGMAGLKDARAVAVQTLSVEHVDEASAESALDGLDGIRLLQARRHRNKLRLGHLRGNRFTIRVRDVGPDARTRARAVLERLAEAGSPNWFGAQRFGMRGDNDAVGRALVRGDADGAVRALLGLGSPDGAAEMAETRRLAADGRHAEAAVLRELARGRTPDRAVLAVPRALLRLYVSAYQSRLFNRFVAARIAALGELRAGDLAYLHDRGAVFAVEDAAAEQPRADAFEISPSGPLFGTRTLLAGGAPGELERAVLAAEEIEPEMFKVRGAGEMSGERRPLRIPVREVDVRDVPAAQSEGERSIVLHFVLPRGCFATALLGEVLKTAESAPPIEPGPGLPSPR